MQAERIADIREALGQAGVREDVVAYATDSTLDERLSVATGLLLLALLLCGFAVGGSCLWPQLEEMAAQQARDRAESVNALLYDCNFGFSMVVAMLAWTCVVAAAAGLLSALSTRTRKNAFVFFVLNGSLSHLSQWRVQRTLERWPNERDPAQFVRRIMTDWARSISLIAVGLALISAFAIVRDVQAHSIFTSTAYVRSPFLPWRSTQAREWSNAASVEAGCNHVDRGGGVSDNVVYRIRFADGASVDIGSAIALGGDWIQAAELIDRQLADAQANVVTLDQPDRDLGAQLCITALRDRFPADKFARLRRLLRFAD